MRLLLRFCPRLIAHGLHFSQPLLLPFGAKLRFYFSFQMRFFLGL